MQIAPFPFERVPRLRRRDLVQLGALRAQVGPGRHAALARWAVRLGLPADERSSLRVAMVEAVEPASVLRFVLHGPDGNRACLHLDAALAAGLIALMLRSPASPICSPPSAGERGLIGYAIAVLLQELGPIGWTVGLEEPPAEPCAVLFETQLRLGDRAGGLAWLGLDEHGLPAPPPHGVELGRAQRLALTLPLELARLRLAADELRALGAEDVVVFPGCPAPAAELAALLRVGAGGFPARVNGLEARIEGPFRMGGPEMAQADEKRVIAEQLELEVVVELGRARLSGAQLLELSPGDVLSLERPLDAPLALRVGDWLVARGELVEVEGETGVRLTELYD